MAIFERSRDGHILNEIRAERRPAEGKLFAEHKERIKRHVERHGSDVLDRPFEAEDIACMAIQVLVGKARESGEYALKEDGTNVRFLYSTANNLIMSERRAQKVERYDARWGPGDFTGIRSAEEALFRSGLLADRLGNRTSI